MPRPPTKSFALARRLNICRSARRRSGGARRQIQPFPSPENSGRVRQCFSGQNWMSSSQSSRAGPKRAANPSEAVASTEQANQEASMTRTKPHALTFARLAGFAPKAGAVVPQVAAAKPQRPHSEGTPGRSTASTPRKTSARTKLDFSYLRALSQDQISRMQAAIHLSK